jgi:predicted MFS family arabinose efflux permease
LLVAAAAVTAGGWRGAFAAGAAVTLGHAMWLASLPLPAPRATREGRIRDGVRSVVTDRRVWYLALLALLLVPLDETYVAYLVAFAQDHHGLSTAGANLLVVAAAAGSLLGFASTSRTGYRPSPHSLRNHAAVMLAAVAVAPAMPLPALAPVLLVADFAGARYWIALKSQIVATRPDAVGTTHAVVGNIEMAGLAFPLVAGRLADTLGIRIAFWSFAAVALATVVLVLLGSSRRERGG